LSVTEPHEEFSEKKNRREAVNDEDSNNHDNGSVAYVRGGWMRTGIQMTMEPSYSQFSRRQQCQQRDDRRKDGASTTAPSASPAGCLPPDAHVVTRVTTPTQIAMQM